MPVLLKTGEVRFPEGGYNTLLQRKDIRVLEKLFDMYCISPPANTYEPNSFFKIFFGIDTANKSRQLLEKLINKLIAGQKDEFNMARPWCLKCTCPAERQEKFFEGAFMYIINWIECTVCLQDIFLAEITHIIGLLGTPTACNREQIHLVLWDDEKRTFVMPAHQIDLIEVYPSLGDQLDWALTAVVTALQNTSRGVPPISLHTPEPLTENTRRLIAPYLNGTF